MPEHVTILGDGAMATVCALLLTQGGHSWSLLVAFEESIDRIRQTRENQLLPGVKIPYGVTLTANEADCFAGCTMILSAIPTQFLRSVWTRIRPYLPPSVPVVSVSKGIENRTLLRPTQVIGDVCGPYLSRKLAALSGPNIAGELARYLPGTAVVA